MSSNPSSSFSANHRVTRVISECKGRFELPLDRYQLACLEQFGRHYEGKQQSKNFYDEDRMSVLTTGSNTPFVNTKIHPQNAQALPINEDEDVPLAARNLLVDLDGVQHKSLLGKRSRNYERTPEEKEKEFKKTITEFSAIAKFGLESMSFEQLIKLLGDESKINWTIPQSLSGPEYQLDSDEFANLLAFANKDVERKRSSSHAKNSKKKTFLDLAFEEAFNEFKAIERPVLGLAPFRVAKTVAKQVANQSNDIPDDILNEDFGVIYEAFCRGEARLAREQMDQQIQPMQSIQQAKRAKTFYEYDKDFAPYVEMLEKAFDSGEL
jgi:hypothetical protein